MSKGYWGPPAMGCVCCHSGPKEKFWCETCDHVCKAPNGWSPSCPACRQPMINMGHRWRPGPRGDRFRHYPQGWKISVMTGRVLGYPVWTIRVVGGGHGYQEQTRRWKPEGTKLRDSRGRILTRREM